METPVNPPEQTPGWETRKDGRVFIDGVDVTEFPQFAHLKEEPPVKEEAPEADVDNASVEGAEVVEPEPEKPKVEAEPKKEEAEKPPEKPAEPEKPKEPDKFKFKTKLRGVEEEAEYTLEQIQANLNRLRMLDQNQKELWQQKKKVEPYAHIVESDWFKAKIKEAYETGELTPPQAPPPADSRTQFEVLKRQADPDNADIVAELWEQNKHLPYEALMLLDSDPTVFLPEYDRVAKERRERLSKANAPPPEKPAEPVKPKPETVKQLLAAKEVAKEKAAVGAPGVAGEPLDPKKEWARERKEIERAMKDPRNENRNLELVAKLLLHIDEGKAKGFVT